jgi:GntR family transcriptional regulator, transcriptional repressor for pyruvate dehydrogenase complex
VLQVVEVRRSLEGEVAALAAARITPAKARQLDKALAAIDAAVAQGRDGVEEDLEFHRTIARITDNPQFEILLDFLEQYLRDAIQVTRANEAMHAEFMRQVRAEHQAIARAVGKGDAAAARRAAVRHMVNAVQRIERADESVRAALGQVLQQAGTHTNQPRKRAS